MNKNNINIQVSTDLKPTAITDISKNHKKVEKNLIQGGEIKRSKKIKSKVLHFLYLFINKKIIQKKNLSKFKIKRKTLKKINQEHITNNNVEFNKKFLKKKLKEIFEVNISHRYKRELNHNAKIIENI